MNGAQLHLALNHFPVILSLTALAFLIWGWLSKKNEIKKAGLILVIATSFFSGAAFLTGEPAEDVLEKQPTFAKELVHEHEEAGEAVLIVSIIAGVLALGALFLDKMKPAFFPYAYALTVVLLIMSSIAFLRTAHLGGLISHEEIRPPSEKP